MQNLSLSPDDLQLETERLFKNLMHVHCEPGKKWTLERCREIAPLTLEINRLKKEQDAVILAHSYVEPEIVYGVADFRSDSYALALEAKRLKAKKIIFAGVVFMAETAKLVCPEAEVIVPDIQSGCSLADSLTGEELRALKAQYPEAGVVCYINSSAEVKAESDVCVTSTNVYDIVAKMPQKQILFVPDDLMAQNIVLEMKARGVDKDIVSSKGTCEVHDQFEGFLIDRARAQFPGLKVVSHPECPTEVTRKSDFVGSTGKMMDYVRETQSDYFMMLTECGLVSRLEAENPGKEFVSGCKLCPYMKLNSLEKLKLALLSPKKEQIIDLDSSTSERALRAIDRMFEMTAQG